MDRAEPFPNPNENAVHGCGPEGGVVEGIGDEPPFVVVGRGAGIDVANDAAFAAIVSSFFWLPDELPKKNCAAIVAIVKAPVAKVVWSVVSPHLKEAAILPA